MTYVTFTSHKLLMIDELSSIVIPLSVMLPPNIYKQKQKRNTKLCERSFNEYSVLECNVIIDTPLYPSIRGHSLLLYESPIH